MSHQLPMRAIAPRAVKQGFGLLNASSLLPQGPLVSGLHSSTSWIHACVRLHLRAPKATMRVHCALMSTDTQTVSCLRCCNVQNVLHVHSGVAENTQVRGYMFCRCQAGMADSVPDNDDSAAHLACNDTSQPRFT